MKVDITDVGLGIITVVGIILIVILIKEVLILSHSPEYVTYEVFLDTTTKIYNSIITIGGLVFASNGLIWYELGKIKQRLGIGKKSRGLPE